VLSIFVEKCVALKIPTSYKFVSNLLKFMYASPSGTGSMKKIEMEKQRLFRSAHCLEQRTYPPEVTNLVSTMHGIFESRLPGVLHVKQPEFIPSHKHSSAHVDAKVFGENYLVPAIGRLVVMQLNKSKPTLKPWLLPYRLIKNQDKSSQTLTILCIDNSKAVDDWSMFQGTQTILMGEAALTAVFLYELLGNEAVFRLNESALKTETTSGANCCEIGAGPVTFGCRMTLKDLLKSLPYAVDGYQLPADPSEVVQTETRAQVKA